ncbi:MAG: hypothetical protein CMJ23_03795 [Phycisphaerae bacterium]|mgnify:CR=1 FL=1|nr:hypothetical protein [Phycisphaerae bacterium]
MTKSGPKDKLARGILFGTMGLLVVGLGRVAQLEIAPADQLIEHLGSRTRSSRLFAFRGEITDRQGRTLACSVLGHDLAVDVRLLTREAERAGRPDPLPDVAAGLAACTELPADQILNQLRANPASAYVRIATAEAMEDIDFERRIKSWRKTGLPGVEGINDGKRWPVPGIVLEERPIRKTITNSPAASIVGAVRSVEWRPPPEEYDRVTSQLIVDVTGFLDWAAAKTPETRDPILRLSTALAAALGPKVNAEIVEERLLRNPGDSDRKVLLVESHLLNAERIRKIRSIKIGTKTVPRHLLLQFTDPTTLKALHHRYPRQIGASGIEAVHDTVLQPRHGRLERTVAAGGDTHYVDEGGYESGRDGEALQLTIDLEFQRFATQRLLKAIDDHHAVGGWLVVADPATGEILAAVDVLHNDRARERNEPVPPGADTRGMLDKFLDREERQDPGFMNPVLRTTAWPTESLDPARDASGLGPSFHKNRIWTDVFAPGSTFKTFFWAWATEHGPVSPSEILDTPGGKGSVKRFSHRDAKGRVRTRTIRDGHGKKNATWETALVKSLNTGMAQVADERISPTSMSEMLQRFGFRNRTGINMGRNAEPTAIAWKPGDPQYSYIYTHLSLSFGQEISCTPLQLTRAFCALARPDGGVPLMTLVQREDFSRFGVPAPQAIEPETVMTTRRVLEKVVESGTGQYGVRSDRYRIFGKSGTAQMMKFVEAARPDPDDPNAVIWTKLGTLGPYKVEEEQRFLPSFIGAAPFDTPRIVVACGLQDPDVNQGDNLLRGGGAYGGGFSAGRVVRDVIEFTLEQLGVPSDKPLSRDVAAAD